MSGVNKAIIIGNLGRDPEVRATQGGTAVCNFSVATSERWNDKQTGEKKEQTEWHKVTCFGRLAELAGEFLRKGSKVYIEGSLRTRQYEKDGVTHYSTEINARELQMLDGRGGASGDAAEPAQDKARKPMSAKRQAQLPAAGGEDFSDDIPFAPFMRESH